MYKRFLKLEILQGESIFLWGARKTGKSTYLRATFPESKVFDLLDTSLGLRYIKEPWLFRSDSLALSDAALSLPIIVDEIQKAPNILDEIHWLIENKKLSFILCGSSARQMKRLGVNMLGGRAMKYHFYPLTFKELGQDFDLLKIFNNGLIPSHYLRTNAKKHLEAYINDYLTHEIKAEGLVRQLAAFNRFLDCVSFSHGELLNYSNIARDAYIDSKTAKEYYNILQDTLMGYFLEPYTRNPNRRTLSSVPKFYLFDVGVANRLMKKSFETLVGADAGKSLEHYIFLELKAYIALNELDHEIHYWRTHSGLEVDFIVHTKSGIVVPIEVKISKNIHKTELRSMKTFMYEYSITTGYVVNTQEVRSKCTYDTFEITICPVREFLNDLWNGLIVNGDT